MSDLHLLSPPPPLGFRAAAVYAGIKSKQPPDVAVLACAQPAVAAAVFTTNRVCAAPVKLGLKHVAGGVIRAIVVNAGNANACTGKQGERDALRMCQLTAQPSELSDQADSSLFHGNYWAHAAHGESRAGHHPGLRQSRKHRCPRHSIHRRDSHHRHQTKDGCHPVQNRKKNGSDCGLL